MRLAVLNPRGHDPEQVFPDFAGAPDSRAHPPINHHAYAACTGGSFHRNVSSVPPDRGVLLLLRSDLALCLKTLEELRMEPRRVAVALKECGRHQVAQLLEKPGNLELFQEICYEADFCMATTPDLRLVYEAAGAKWTEFIPTPYPVGDARWDFSIPVEQRGGIFIGTREFGVPSRNHVAALLCARAVPGPVTVINTEGRTGRRQLTELGYEEGSLRVVEGPLPYPEYLRLMAGHRLVFQLDRSGVPGQVAGDALLCGLPCVGGDGAVDQIAFEAAPGTYVDCIRAVVALQEDEALYAAAVEKSQARARERLGFQPIREQLDKAFGIR